VVPVKVETLCREGGGIHCVTQQEPLGIAAGWQTDPSPTMALIGRIIAGLES
jgi:hypothetical protein